MFRGSAIGISEIAPGDFNVAIVGQLTLAQLALSDAFESRPLQMVGLDAALRGHGAVDKSLENSPRNPDQTFVFPDADTELEEIRRRVPASIVGEAEEHDSALVKALWLPGSHRAQENTSIQSTAAGPHGRMVAFRTATKYRMCDAPPDEIRVRRRA
jgi:hypothetical protein